jgi:LysM repeat protein
MKKVLAVLVVLGIGGWLCYSNGVFSMVTGGKVPKGPGAASTSPESAKRPDPYMLCAKGDYKEAVEILADRVEHEKGDSTPEDLRVLGLSYRGLGDGDKAKATWQKLLREYPASKSCGDACFGLAEISREKGDAEEELSYLEKAASDYSSSEGGAKAALRLGSIYLTRGEKCKARVAYSRALRVANEAEKKKIKEILAKLNREIIYSPVPNEHAPVYCVRPGDSLGRIAKKFGTTVGLIKSINRLDTNTIFPGDRLKIVKGTVHLEVFKAQFTLSVFIEGVWVRDYSIGIGANDKTPEGSFEIETKIVDPPWHFRGKVYGRDDPENILGSRWMGFKRKPGLYGFGIHGTTEPGSVPGAVSRGCIRMRNKDVEALFEVVPRGAKVHIFP